MSQGCHGAPPFASRPRHPGTSGRRHAIAYDQAAAQRLRAALKRTRNIAEQKMFGGICFMWRGNMLCGTGWRGVMFRVGKEQEAAALKLPGASRMVLAGRRFVGFVWVKPDRCKGAALKKGLALAKRYVGPMPAKKKRKK